jgi:hypothetical protein
VRTCGVLLYRFGGGRLAPNHVAPDPVVVVDSEPEATAHDADREFLKGPERVSGRKPQGVGSGS